ncbi:hypothetical protein WKW50_24980 [Ochrobactrum sp. GPK 3]|uniref:hypothetical protein n=1 Tax=Brucella sp. 22210 TaxID=3453892 RepID=UPI003138552D
MPYLLTQMWLYMLAAFMLGLSLGWILWGHLKKQLYGLSHGLRILGEERDRFRSDLDACRNASATQILQSMHLAEEATSPVVPPKDNLRRLIGIGPTNEKLLNDAGITTYAQIAAWTADDVAAIERLLNFGGRVERENWVEQARLLAAHQEEEFLRRFPTSSSITNT